MIPLANPGFHITWPQVSTGGCAGLSSTATRGDLQAVLGTLRYPHNVVRNIEDYRKVHFRAGPSSIRGFLLCSTDLLPFDLGRTWPYFFFHRNKERDSLGLGLDAGFGVYCAQEAGWK